MRTFRTVLMALFAVGGLACATTKEKQEAPPAPTPEAAPEETTPPADEPAPAETPPAESPPAEAPPSTP